MAKSQSPMAAGAEDAPSNPLQNTSYGFGHWSLGVGHAAVFGIIAPTNGG
jgi:hypothetical protein